MLNSLNQYLGDYIGRRFPTSMLELKTNVSNNVKTCAKICSLFLNSSFGVGVAMGVVGIVTTSLCAGKGVLPILTSTILPFTTEGSTTASATNASSTDLVFLCFKDVVQNTLQNALMKKHFTYVKPLMGTHCNVSVMEIDCVRMRNNTMANAALLTPQCIDFGYKGFYDDKRYYPALDLYKSEKSVPRKNVTMLVQTPECLLEHVFYVANVTVGKVIALLDMKRGFCQSSNQTSHQRIDDFCYQGDAIRNYVAAMRQNITEECLLPAPVSTVASLTTSVLSDSFDECNTMQLVFGVGSTVVLVATVAKVIYQQHKVARFNNSKASSSRLIRATTVLCNDGLLLGAAGLGYGVLLKALRDHFGPVDESANKLVVASTIMYGMSAGASLVKALTSRELEDPNADSGIYDDEADVVEYHDEAADVVVYPDEADSGVYILM